MLRSIIVFLRFTRDLNNDPKLYELYQTSIAKYNIKGLDVWPIISISIFDRKQLSSHCYFFLVFDRCALNGNSKIPVVHFLVGFVW